MKRFFVFFGILFSLLLSNQSVAQQRINRFEEFKKMKMSFILEKTNLTDKEKNSFEPLFQNSEKQYHDEVWIVINKLKKELLKPFDTISSENAFKYINDYNSLEQLGMTIKHERNRKFLEVIRPEIVLRILVQEIEFDQLMFKRIRNSDKKN
jgi:hypothetical protein